MPFPCCCFCQKCSKRIQFLLTASGVAEGTDPLIFHCTPPRCVDDWNGDFILDFLGVSQQDICGVNQERCQWTSVGLICTGSSPDGRYAWHLRNNGDGTWETLLTFFLGGAQIGAHPTFRKTVLETHCGDIDVTYTIADFCNTNDPDFKCNLDAASFRVRRNP